MITVIEDLDSYEAASADALVGSGINDYVPIRQQIQRALATTPPPALEVIIRHPTLVHWLSDLRQYPHDIIKWRTVDPLQQFYEHFGTPPPPELSPALIAALDVQHIPMTPTDPTPPVTQILRHRLGSVWGCTTPTRAHLTELVGEIARRTDPIPPELIPVIGLQLREWAQSIPTYAALRADDLVAASRRLLMRGALHAYASEWLTEQRLGDLPTLDVEAHAALCVALLSPLSAAITAHWNREFARHHPLSPEVLATLCARMSGMSMAELECVARILEQNPTMLTAPLLDALTEQFRWLGHDVQPTLIRLQTQIVPELPPLPDAAWDVTQWLDWATTAYMPYFAWVVRTRQPREHQQACALAFSDWLAAQYPQWLIQPTSPLLTRQFTMLREILADDPQACVVWLVADGLTWWQGQRLGVLCMEHGLHVVTHDIGVAALPSITSISKRVLITGLPATIPDSRSLAEIAREHSTRSGLTVRVCRELTSLADILRAEPTVQVVLVLYNMLDTIAHQQTQFTDDRGIQGYLQQLAIYFDDCRRACDQFTRTYHALIGSDHGSTLLPADAPALPLPSASSRVADDDDDPDAHHRPLTRSTRAVVVPQLAQHRAGDQWYVLDPHRYQLPELYLVPRGYGYAVRRPIGWTHGGLTPEEVIVPLLHVVAHAPAWLALDVSLHGQLRANQASLLEMQIVNPNPFPVTVRHTTLDAPHDPVAPFQLAALDRRTLTIALAAPHTPAATLPVAWNLTTTSAAGKRTQHGQADVPIRRLQTTDPRFDDMFA